LWAKNDSVSAEKWRLNPGARPWRADGARVGNVSVCDWRDALRITPAHLALNLITAYQKYIRPAIPASCRFEPGCSEYTSQAIIKYGLIKGVCKGLTRILRCHPFSGRSGYDPLT